MSRANIGEAYYRLKYRSPESDSPVSDQLNEELVRLRESTRKALQQSWDEVELLRQQCSVSNEVIAQNDKVLIEMRNEKEDWQTRCLTAEATLHAIETTFDSTSEQRDTLLNPSRFSYTQNVRSWVGRNDNKKDKDKDKDWPKDVHNVLELVLKMSSRDDAISSLEQILDEKLKSMQNMEVEMHRLAEKHRIKEQKAKDSYTQKEQHLNELVDSLRKQLTNTSSMDKHNAVVEEKDNNNQHGLKEEIMNSAPVPSEEEYRPRKLSPLLIVTGNT